MFILAQVLGFIGFVFLALSVQMKEKKRILAFQIVAGVFYVAQFALLNAMTAAVINLIVLIRSIVFYYKDMNSDKISKKFDVVVLVILALSMIIFGVITYNNVFSIIPPVAALIELFLMWKHNTKLIRYGMGFTSLLWVVYGISVMAYVGAITSAIMFISSIVGAFRHERKKIEE